VDEIQGLLNSGEIKTGPLLALGYVSFNLKRPPFDDRRVRQAFNLAVDRNYIVNRITRAGQKPAGGLVPYGSEDGTGNDFRQAGGDYYSVAAADYQKNTDEARHLMAEAGYLNGEGFPVVEYLYNSGDTIRAIAEALQDMWKTALGVNITLANQDWAVFIDTRAAGNYQITRNAWTADYSDPITFLEIFTSENGNNDSRTEAEMERGQTPSGGGRGGNPVFARNPPPLRISSRIERGKASR
jgi:oligopeptide transport system substrate-binding protein